MSHLGLADKSNKKVFPNLVPWRFTDKQFTPWGGLRVFEEMLTRLGWPQALASAPLPQPRSNRGLDPVLMVKAFMVTIWTGGGRFAHTAMVRFDGALRGIFGLEQVASTSTFTRFFRRFDRRQVEELFRHWSGWIWQRVAARSWTVDLDSSVLTRYGEQEGVELGYNPWHRGKKSHHPLMAFAVECRMVITAWLRSGNTTDSSNAENFFREVLQVLGPRHRIGLLRCDSGFCIGSFLDLVESQDINYIVVARLLGTIKRELAGLQDWIELDGHRAVGEFTYQAQGWSRARRVVAVRHRLSQRGEGKMLLEVPGYTYSVYVTNLSLPALQVRTLYQGRGGQRESDQGTAQRFCHWGFCQPEILGDRSRLPDGLLRL